MSKTAKRVVIACIAVAAICSAAVLYIWPMFRSGQPGSAPEAADAEYVPDSKFVEQPQEVDKRLWSALLVMANDYGPYNKEIAEAYKEKDRDKFMCILAKQVIVNLGRCRRQLDNTADDPDVGYRDEVLLYYALRLRSLELSYAEPILKKLADKNDQSVSQDQIGMMQYGEFIAKEVAMLSDLYRCAQLHGGYLLCSGKSEDEVRRDFASLGLADPDIDNCLAEAKQRCAMLKNSASGAAASPSAQSAGTADKLAQYSKDYPRFYRSGADRMWNTANYLSLCLHNDLWWMKTFSNKRDDELQKKLSDELAADLQMCRRKIEAAQSDDAPEVKKAALEMCTLGDSVINNYNEYRSGRMEYEAFQQTLKKDAAAYFKLKTALYEARRAYLLRNVKDSDLVNHAMFNDGISPIQLND